MISDENQTPQLTQTAVKCRFFAQYWGQIYEFKNTKTKWTINEGAFPLEKEGNERLILTDLKNISDEDCEFISKNIAGVSEEEYKLKEINVVKEMLYKYLSDFKNTDSYVLDYLRSKGYAVPFMEYSVEDLISFGWVRLV
jgi:hypothetical protein